MTVLELVRRIRQWRREHGYSSSLAWAQGVVQLLKGIGLIEIDGLGNVRIPEVKLPGETEE
ncbi:unnamed protein product [marine sediment metagenome]|uniref:Uncharacterized protein n=1 Tax=marine sediment metagenome TaxID=412755 RepID=X1RTW9_9ZZZZ